MVGSIQQGNQKETHQDPGHLEQWTRYSQVMFHSFWRILKERIKCIWHEAEMVAVLREEVPADENNLTVPAGGIE